MLRPEFFDIFGTVVFLFITVSALWALLNGRRLPRWALMALFLIGIAGLFVDSYIVYIFYL